MLAKVGDFVRTSEGERGRVVFIYETTAYVFFSHEDRKPDIKPFEISRLIVIDRQKVEIKTPTQP
jgi:hypothetical protein